jgi:hypothetical protein
MSERKLNLDDLKAGDVILFPPPKGDWIAQAIAFLTQSELDHAALCYFDPGTGKLRIVESVLKGLAVRDFDASVPAEYPLRVNRMKEERDMDRLMAAAKRYLDEKEKYPFFNLGLLGLLLLFKKFAISKIEDKIFYDFLTVVVLLILEAVQKMYKGKHPMTCSQFVAQCFTDAGDDFDLQFDKLVVQYDTTEDSSARSLFELIPNSINPREWANSSRVCLSTGESPWIHIEAGTAEGSIQLVAPEKLTAQFIALMKKPESAVPQARTAIPGASGPDSKTRAEIGTAAASIALALYSIISGQETESLETAMDFLKNFKDSTARNYFVSPEDIFSNCPKSLDKIGLLSY